MAFWRYIRDVFLAIAALLIISGLVVSWWAFCLLMTVAAVIGSFFIDCKNWHKK